MRRFRTQFDATDSAGLNSIYYARTVKGNDLIQRNTWFTYDYENDNREPTYRRVRFTWNYSYHMIGQTNILITRDLCFHASNKLLNARSVWSD